MFFCGGLSAESIGVSQDAITSNFGPQIELLADAPLTMTAAEALKSPLLVPYDRPIVNLGLQDAPVWMRFRVENPSDEWGAWILNTLRTNVEILEIYKSNADGIELLFDNANIAQRQSSVQRHFNLVAPLALAPNETATIIVRFKAAVSGWLPMRIIPISLLTQFTFSQFSLFIFSIAGTGVLIVFNLLIFLAARDKLYILYSAATTSLVLACLHLQGLTTAWWFYASPEWGRTFGITAIALAALMLITFARRFLQLKGRVFADYWYRIAALALGLHIIVIPGSVLVAPTFTNFLASSGWITALSAFISLPLQAFFAGGGRRLERTLLGVAWTALATQFTWLVLSGLGIVPAGNLDWYLLGPVCFMEASLVAISIAVRVRRLQEEKETSDARSTLALQDMNERARMVLAASHDAGNLVSGALSLNERIEGAQELTQAKSDARKSRELLDSLQQTMSVMVSHSRQVGSGSIPMIETINVAELFGTLALTFRERSRQQGKRITFRTTLESVAGDRYMLSRVLSNLLNNAVMYAKGERVLIVCRGHVDAVLLRVYDQGPGLSAGDLAQVLLGDRSVRLSPQSEGIGVGLRSSKDLAAAYGASLEAASKIDGGSMFGLRLPMPDLASIGPKINFLGDRELWQSHAALLKGGSLVDQHRGEAGQLYVFSESVQVAKTESINVVACVDRSTDNRDKWSQLADVILCFPVTLPALAYASWLACRRRDLEVID